MTSVNVTNNVSEVSVTDDAGAVVVVERNEVAVVSTVVEGPQGPIGPQGPSIGSLADIGDVDATNVADKSVLVYDSATAKYKVDSVWTTDSLADGGNF